MDNPGDSSPLTWDEARSRLRKVLEDYLLETSSSRRKYSKNTQPVPKEPKSFLDWWIEHDFDLYAGSLSLSVAFLILAGFSLEARRRGVGLSPLNAAASISVYRAEVASGCLLVVGSMISLWMVRRRRFLFQNDSFNAKRSEVVRFLRAFDRETEEIKAANVHHANTDCAGLDLLGTALTDIYPVYRVSGHEEEEAAAAGWSRIPSLLLVEGDFVALQVGDTTPADCISLEAKPGDGNIQLNEGELVSLESIGENSISLTSKLPQGKITLPSFSNHLLTLCNGIRIFVVRKAPLFDFIRHAQGRLRSSQQERKVTDLRKALALAAPTIMIVTAIIVFSRPGAADGDLSLILPLPFMAALGLFPVVGPAFAFFLEMIGTSRILTTVHPYTNLSSEDSLDTKQVFLPRTRLLFRYMMATLLTRMSLWEFARLVRDLLVRLGVGTPRGSRPERLIRIPPASLGLLENLGVATALALVDDELACEPHAVPQQLLIPSAKGLKLLDICPTYDDEDSDTGKDSDTQRGRNKGKSFDSDSSEDGTQNYTSLRRKVVRTSRMKRREVKGSEEIDATEDDTSVGVQFEEPTWWQHLPTLKGIGLAGLVMDEGASTSRPVSCVIKDGFGIENTKASLVSMVCAERRCIQLRILAKSIGFSTEENDFGPRGDLSPFKERLRLHILSNNLFRARVEKDAHERSSDWSRWWGLLRPDCTSVIVEDARSSSCQVLTVGDPAVVSSLCNEAWQGEILTILPLAGSARQTILETSEAWKLSDLDVTAFSYAPVPHSLEGRLVGGDGGTKNVYLMDHGFDPQYSIGKDRNMSQEWNLIRNQVFLGVLASLVVPRREIQSLLGVLNDAGVRFVYFSPRNMRRQKELASQMGIDVAWNCAISLRPLESGEEDPHRMVSNYADWDVNAKLPHGVDNVRKHLEGVDNVPLLVSLFTDVTKQTTMEMVEIFQDYCDTVIAIGISHLPQNDGIFSAADIAIGIDLLMQSGWEENFETICPNNGVRPSEVEFVSAICSHSCVFRFQGSSSLSHIPSILKQSRAALEAATASGVFLVEGCLAYSLYVLFSVCSPTTTIPFVPFLGSVLYIQFVLPGIGYAMAMSDAETEAMHRVPPKNDQAVTFSKREGRILYTTLVAKAFMPALLSQLQYWISFGELALAHHSDLLQTVCPGVSSWSQVIRCPALKDYSGDARTSAGGIALGQFVICIAISSASFVYRHVAIQDQQPWANNNAWVASVVIVIALVAVYIAVTVEPDTASALPWYFYAIAIIEPFLCLAWNEVLKTTIEVKPEKRSEKLRRLQFETRLGAWSPK